MGKKKDSRRPAAEGDEAQFQQNMSFLEKEIEKAKRNKLRREVARLKLKALVIKLRHYSSVKDQGAASEKASSTRIVKKRVSSLA